MVVIDNVSCLTMTAKYDVGTSYPNFHLLHQIDIQGEAGWSNDFGSGSGGLPPDIWNHASDVMRFNSYLHT